MKLPDDVWLVIKSHLHDYRNIDADERIRQAIELNTDIHVFDGGAFVSRGNEFDLFVVPEKRGKWNIRGEVSKFLDKMSKVSSTIVVKINEDNNKSLRLARHFGFVEVTRENGIIRMEKYYG